MNLVIDIGNTNTKAAIFEKDKMISFFQYPVKKINNSLIHKLLIDYKNKINHAGLSSVIKHGYNIWVKQIKVVYGINTLLINSEISLPINLRIQKKRTFGSDRICTASAAHIRYPGKNLIVIDHGTAVTINVILKNGDFIGGLIAPGIHTSLKALYLNTSKLPILTDKQLIFPKNIPGKNTESAIRSGILLTAVEGLSGIIENILSEFKRDFTIILTGGSAQIIRNKLKYKAIYKPYLSLDGINELIKYNL